MSLNQEKAKFLEEWIRRFNSLRDAKDALPSMRQEAIDNGWHSTGADPLTDEDLVGYGFTQADFTQSLNLANQLGLFMENGTPAQAFWRRVVNVISRRS